LRVGALGASVHFLVAALWPRQGSLCHREFLTANEQEDRSGGEPAIAEPLPPSALPAWPVH